MSGLFEHYNSKTAGQILIVLSPSRISRITFKTIENFTKKKVDDFLSTRRTGRLRDDITIYKVKLYRSENKDAGNEFHSFAVRMKNVEANRFERTGGEYAQVHRMSLPLSNLPMLPRNETAIRDLTRMATSYFWSAYSSISENGSYMAIATVFLVVLLSFLLPDISLKIHRNNEMKAMKKVLDLMTNEVSQAEMACLATTDQIGDLQCSMHDDTTETSHICQKDLAVCTSYSIKTTQSLPVKDENKMGKSLFKRIFPSKNTSNKEITLMSFLYTDSFDAQGKKIDTPKSS